MKVLIVDDNAESRRLLRYNFLRHGYEVLEASDGQEGLETARLQRPDLIVSDALMPRMDGFQFLREIRSDENLSQTPFVFYSAVYTGVADEQLTQSLGADAFIVKPKEPDDFWTDIENMIAARRLQKEQKQAQELEEREYLKRHTTIISERLEEKVKELE
ncbi:MAG: response regulator, partial [Nitrospirales bacterium]|nr:response regulator [Nitrospirales bacterium]